MPYNTKTVERDGSGITPVPQHFNPVADVYEPIFGRNGASRVELYGPDGTPISTSAGKLDVRASEVETLLTALGIKDYATQTTLAAILAKIIAAPSTEAKQEAIRLLLGSLDGKDFSTLAKQNEILTKLTALETKLNRTLDVQLSGSKMEIYGASLATRPAATAVAVGATFTIVDDTGNFDSYISNGTDWLEV